LNGDGSSEVIFTTYVSGAPRQPAATTHLIVLSADGKLQHSIPLSGRGSMAAPSIADLEGDGNLELVISLKDTLDENGQGGVQIWELPDSDTRCMQWPTGRGNLLRNGAFRR
jgi:hypothetical protein